MNRLGRYKRRPDDEGCHGCMWRRRVNNIWKKHSMILAQSARSVLCERNNVVFCVWIFFYGSGSRAERRRRRFLRLGRRQFRKLNLDELCVRPTVVVNASWKPVVHFVSVRRKSIGPNYAHKPWFAKTILEESALGPFNDNFWIHLSTTEFLPNLLRQFES